MIQFLLEFLYFFDLIKLKIKNIIFFPKWIIKILRLERQVLIYFSYLRTIIEIPCLQILVFYVFSIKIMYATLLYFTDKATQNGTHSFLLLDERNWYIYTSQILILLSTVDGPFADILNTFFRVWYVSQTFL